jgi:hypothetical protein
MAEGTRVFGLVAVGLILAACGGGGTAEPTDTSGQSEQSGSAVADTDVEATVAPESSVAAATGPFVVDGEFDVAALDALATEFAALDEQQQFDRLDELSAQFERDLYNLSGLEEALGGTEAVDESITEAGSWFAETAVEVRTAVMSAEFEPQGIRRAAPGQTDGVPSVGMGLFGGMMVTILGGEAAVSATNDGKTGSGDLAGGGKLEVTGDTAAITAEHAETDSHGVTTTLKTRNVVTPCPAPDGTFTASASIDTSSTINQGATGKRATLEVTITGTVDDNAALVGYDITSRSQYADFVESKGGFLDLTLTIPRSGGASGEVNRSGGTVTPAIVETAVALNRLMLVVAAGTLSRAAQTGWQSGRCVELTPTVSAGPKGLSPSASVTITAAPRSKIDGGPTGGTVTALLTGGEAAINPSSTPVPADAEFTYEAPGERDKTGTVSLEARSKRGVAKATIEFDTKAAYAYQIVGGLDDFQTNTAVCDVLAPFNLSGGGISVDFSGGLSGTYTYSGVFSAAGGGEYVITLPNGPGQPGTMVGGGVGTVQTGASASGTENYALTPITC